MRRACESEALESIDFLLNSALLSMTLRFRMLAAEYIYTVYTMYGHKKVYGCGQVSDAASRELPSHCLRTVVQM